MAATRILITGVSRFWGTELARRLEADDSIDQIVAIDSEAPARQLSRTDYVRADIRHSLVGRLVRELDIDTVVHAGLVVDPLRAGARSAHETNVIGTMNLLAACGGSDSPVRRLVVKSSTAVYGAEPDDPSFWTEDMRRRSLPRDLFTRDLDEVESYVREFEARHPTVEVALLRFGNVLGQRHDTPFGRLFDRRVVPTVLGFDPRLQFLDEEDAVAVLDHVTRGGFRGTYNVAGSGTVVLSRAISMLGKIGAPVLPFVGGSAAMRILDRAGLAAFPPELVRLLKYGRVVDTARLHTDLGFVPARTTVETVAEFGRRRRVRRLLENPVPYRPERDLEDFLRSRGGPRRQQRARPSPPVSDGPGGPVRARARRRRSPARAGARHDEGSAT